jgi:excisionase family DNA binding protein
MTTQVLQYVELSAKDRKAAKPLGEALGSLGKGDRVEVRVRRKSGKDEVVSLPPKAAALLEAVLEQLLRGERVAVLAEDVEVSPNEAAEILGMSRPLVVHRMDRGHLPFRYVGNHRRATLKDVLAFKEKVDAQRALMKELTDLGEELWEQYGV